MICDSKGMTIFQAKKAEEKPKWYTTHYQDVYPGAHFRQHQNFSSTPSPGCFRAEMQVSPTLLTSLTVNTFHQ